MGAQHASMPSAPQEEEVLELVGAWIDLLAEGQFFAAYQYTAHDPYYGWSPKKIAAVIAGYGLPDPHPTGVTYRVTPRKTASGAPSERRVTWFDGPSPRIALVTHSLPLNGKWSDLVAAFRVEVHDDASRLVLEEIHVP